MSEIDNTYKGDGKPFRRFFLRRLKDETGVSRTGRVLEGVLAQSGKVFVEWRPPHSTMGIYNSFEEFKIIHVDCHPSCNEVVWIDKANFWHCFGCGASGMDGNFCQMCGSPSTAYDSVYQDFQETERYRLERELEYLNNKMRAALSLDEQQRRGEIVKQLCATENS